MRLASFLTGGLALLLIACGGSSNGETRVATPTSIRVPQPTPTEHSQVASSTLVAPEPVGRGTREPPCDDPYIGGAPYRPTPSTPVRLSPRGTSEPLPSYAFTEPRVDSTLQRFIQTGLGGEAERVSVFIKNLDDGSGVMLDPDREFYAASLYKIWVMAEAFNQQRAGLLDWDELYVVSTYYASWGLNPGELRECETVSLGEALELMMSRSENVAANVMLERVGAGNINRTLRSLGLAVSGLVGDSRLPTTARETALLLEAMYEGEVVSEAAAERMMELLSTEQVDDRLPALLPPDVAIAHKTGNWENATHDAGVVFSKGAPYIIVVLTDYGFMDNGGGLIAELSRIVYDYYNPD